MSREKSKPVEKQKGKKNRKPEGRGENRDRVVIERVGQGIANERDSSVCEKTHN